MHIHGHSTNFNAVDLASTRGAEKAASTQRAAEVRSQLVKGGFDTEGEVNPFESFMVGKEWEGSSRQEQSQKRRQAPAHDVRRLQSDEQASVESVEEPLSFWA